VAHQTLLLSRREVRECLDMPTSLEIVERVFRVHGEGRAIMPPKLELNLAEVADCPSKDALLLAMPAYLGPMHAAGLKWAGIWRENPKRALPYVMASVLLVDTNTGVLLAVMEGGYITDVRTGAATGVAVKCLAKKTAKAVAIIGAGRQGRMQIRALSCLLPIEDVRVMDVDPEVAKDFAAEIGKELGLSIRPTGRHQEAAEGADIIVTVTTAHEILVRREWVSPGTFIASVGSCPELDPQILFKADKVLVDSWAQNKSRGELSELVEEGRFGERDLYGEVGEVVAGKKAGRENDQEIIVSCFMGLGSHDVGCAQYVYEEAKRRGIGTLFPFHQEILD